MNRIEELQTRGGQMFNRVKQRLPQIRGEIGRTLKKHPERKIAGGVFVATAAFLAARENTIFDYSNWNIPPGIAVPAPEYMFNALNQDLLSILQSVRDHDSRASDATRFRHVEAGKSPDADPHGWPNPPALVFAVVCEPSSKIQVGLRAQDVRGEGSGHIKFIANFVKFVPGGTDPLASATVDITPTLRSGEVLIVNEVSLEGLLNPEDQGYGSAKVDDPSWGSNYGGRNWVACEEPLPPPTPTPEPSITATYSSTSTATLTATATRTATVTGTSTRTLTATVSPTVTQTPTVRPLPTTVYFPLVSKNYTRRLEMEQVIVPFSSGLAGVQTRFQYRGPVRILCEGGGLAFVRAHYVLNDGTGRKLDLDGWYINDCFWLLYEADGTSLPYGLALHPIEHPTFTLAIDAKTVESFDFSPPYRFDRKYDFSLQVGDFHQLSFGFSDHPEFGKDGTYTVTILIDDPSRVIGR